LAGKRKKGQGLLGKTPLSSSPDPEQGRADRPAGMGLAGGLSGLGSGLGEGEKGESRGDLAPALTSSSDGPRMALRGGATVVRCGGGGGALGGSASLLARCGVVRRWRLPFIGPEGRF
jgi:hypothetical protein